MRKSYLPKPLTLTFSIIVAAIAITSCNSSDENSTGKNSAPNTKDTNAEKTFTLFNFTKESDVKKWFVRKSTPETKFEVSNWPDGETGQCAKIVFPEWQEKSGQWPAAILKNENVRLKDWRSFKSMTFEVYSDYDGITPMKIHLRDTKGGGVQTDELNIKKGHQTITIDSTLFSGIDSSQINEIHFFMTRPTKEYTCYFGNILLHSMNLEVKISTLKKQQEEIEKEVKNIKNVVLPVAKKADCVTLLNESKTLLRKASKMLKADSNNITTLCVPITKAEDNLEKIRAILPMLKAANTFSGKEFAWGETSSIEKVYRTDYTFAGEWGKTLNISLAKNEYEATQLVIFPFKDIENVSVKTSDLKNTNGDTLSANHIKINPVGYILCKQPPYAVKRTGWHPDPILNYCSSLDLDAYKWQSFWIEAYAPKIQKAGIYSGKITISGNGVAPVYVPITITVNNFTLQDGSRLPLALSWSSGDFTLSPIYLKDKKKIKEYNKAVKAWTPISQINDKDVRRSVEIRRKTTDMLMEHRLTADRIYRGFPPSVEEAKYILSKGAKYFNIISVSCSNKIKKGTPFPAKRKKRILDYLAEYVPQYKKAGILKNAYIYGFDEVRENVFFAMKDILSEIKKRYPEIPIMTTAYDHSFGKDTGLDSYMDIWVPLTPKYATHMDSVDAARKRGKNIWWYICCGPKHPYANWFVEYPAIEHRLVMGFMPYKYKSEGFLYYCLVMWRKYEKTKDGSWKASARGLTMNGAPLTDWEGYTWHNYNGDGNILYPGKNGPISSLRAKNIRDGLDDYIYLKMLEDAVNNAKSGKLKVTPVWLNNAEKALTVNPELVDTLKRYSYDTKLLLSERNKISGLLNQINN